MRTETLFVPLCLAAASLAAPPASAGGLEVTTEHGVEFVTVGDPGNRHTRPEEGNPIFADVHVPQGNVDYEYRVARTEVTVGQYFEFVEAYAPRYFDRTGKSIAGVDFTGANILAGFDGIRIRPGVSPDRAADMSWEYAARYVNWLHNGKADEGWAFETGVYDTGTFTREPDGTWNHQAARNPGSRFWIPSDDEWIKAAYWDPEKDGGAGGYWLFPNGSDSESVPGLLPEDGGERNAGPGAVEGGPFPLDVGSFEGVQSPWGLFDMAGGESEWSETVVEEAERRYAYGTRWVEDAFGDPYFPNDIIGSGVSNAVWDGAVGLRLAAVVPAPGGAVVAATAVVIHTQRRRRENR